MTETLLAQTAAGLAEGNTGSDEFMENLKIDLFTDEVFVLHLKVMLNA